MVASLKSVASRKVVMDANEMLVRMSHRGGVGCCPASGDGAGEYVVFLLYLFAYDGYLCPMDLFGVAYLWCMLVLMYDVFTEVVAMHLFALYINRSLVYSI